MKLDTLLCKEFFRALKHEVTERFELDALSNAELEDELNVVS